MSEIVLLRNQPDRLRELRDSVAKGASDAEFGFFVSVCDRLGLCPFNRQIFLIERWDSQLGRNVKTPQVSIDGFRLVAQRSREYQGQTQTMWADSEGRWSDLWTSADPPFAARVGVWRDGFKEPLIATALWSEYAARKKDGSVMTMWKKMPALMLAKCAEALALRKLQAEGESAGDGLRVLDKAALLEFGSSVSEFDERLAEAEAGRLEFRGFVFCHRGSFGSVRAFPPAQSAAGRFTLSFPSQTGQNRHAASG